MLDRLNSDTEEYRRLEEEANSLVDEIEPIREMMRQMDRDKLQAERAKVEEIRGMVARSETDALIDKYGHEFINDYTIEGNTVFSKVSHDHQDNSWETDNPEKKVRQLVYWRIYDHYLRGTK
jgi:hypothetical protein